MRMVHDYSLEVTEGKTIDSNGEYICVCPICEENISDSIDDFNAAFYCPICDNAVKFPESKIIETKALGLEGRQ